MSSDVKQFSIIVIIHLCFQARALEGLDAFILIVLPFVFTLYTNRVKVNI